MLKRYIMSSISKVKPTTGLERPPSAATGGQKAQIRAFKANSSPVYKTQSDSNLVSKMKNLSLKDRKNPRPIGRAFMSTNGGSNGVTNIKSLADVAACLNQESFKNIVVMAGAGISCPSGIPDFRTPGTGLYDNLAQYKIPYPEAIFDIDYFQHNPKPFFTLAKELYPSGKYRPNYIHYFVRLLHDKGMLLRMYTQNIDGLERLAGIPVDKMVESHGSFTSATCMLCRQPQEGCVVKEAVFNDKIPLCRRGGCPGVLKPDIVFFGEELPKKFYWYIKDMMQADLVLVMGTSLEVQPFAGIVDHVRFQIPRVLFNMYAVGPFRYGKRPKDLVSEGDLVKNMVSFVESVGWKEEMEKLIIESEGTFRICDPEYEKNAAKRKVIKPKPVPVQRAVWQQNDSESDNTEESSEESDASSSSADSSDSSVGRGRRHKPSKAWQKPRKTSAPRIRTPPRHPNSANATRKYSRLGTTRALDLRNNINDKNTRNYCTNVATSRSERSLNRVTTPVSVDRKKSLTPKPSNSGQKLELSNVNSSNKNSTIRRSVSEKSFLAQKLRSLKGKRERPSSEKSTHPISSKSSVKENSNSNKVNGTKDDTSEVDSKEISKLPPSEGKKPPRPPIRATLSAGKELNALNTKPYGFGSPRKLLDRPTIPANGVGVKNRIPSTGLDFRSDSPCGIPRIAYRHRLAPSYDARIFAIRVPISSSSSSSSEKSDDESDD